MNTNGYSLRLLVDKWLAPTGDMPAHVAQVGRTIATHCRFVRFEGRTPAGPVTIVFFRHGDGAWCVFPPVPAAPSMSARLF